MHPCCCLLALLLAALAPLSAQQQTFQVTETSIAATEAALRNHQVTCRQLVESYQQRIAAYDQTTHLNTVVVMNPQALADADGLDREFHQSGHLRPLHCVVMAIKDNYDTAGLETTGGSLALRGFAPASDATMVAKLRAAGAIVLFKSNMAEWAFSPLITESSIAGITRNPYDLRRVPAGSSGGTASAVSASLAEVGLGTDTGDSIRGPASHTDLVGIRPTLGLTSRAGIVPLFLTQDIGGPLARSVADAAAVLSAVAGEDPADPLTASAHGHVAPDYTQFLDPHGLRGARIGVFQRYVEEPTGDPEVKALTGHAVDELRAAGATVVDVELPDFDRLTNDLGCGSFQADLNQYLATHAQAAEYHTLREIVDSGLYLPGTERRLKYALDQKPLAAPCPDVWHDPAKQRLRDALLAAMDTAHLDAIVYPTWSNPPRLVGDLKSPGGDNNQVLSPQTGFPAITVPMGFTHGNLPAGLQFLGRAWSEPVLFRLAYGYEQSTHPRVPPALFPALDKR